MVVRIGAYRAKVSIISQNRDYRNVLKDLGLVENVAAIGPFLVGKGSPLHASYLAVGETP